jgi:hypothetical protein
MKFYAQDTFPYITPLNYLQHHYPVNIWVASCRVVVNYYPQTRNSACEISFFFEERVAIVDLVCLQSDLSSSLIQKRLIYPNGKQQRRR